ncbi:MAG: glycogen/starch/alpha-glucan phosphorylase [Longicatena sp.]
MITIKEKLEKAIQEKKKNKTVITLEDVYDCVFELTLNKSKEVPKVTGDKKLYYISAEFLLGKMLTSNLLNMHILEDVKAVVEENGFSFKDLQDLEKEPSLGNGGLGRLAACFLDSIASLNLYGDGIGLYYHLGLFEQRFLKNEQIEVPNTWMQDNSWFSKRKQEYMVSFPNFSLKAICYDMDVLGYHGKKNTLHLFDVESVDETIVKKGISFDKTDIEKNLTLFLYPDDSDEEGRLLRIYQQYFMVSCGAQMILEDCKEKGYDLNDLAQHVMIQINDTHPSLVIPELIRLLMLEGILMKDAIKIVKETCAYTNHTILAEALETWPIDYLKKVVPTLLPIIETLDALVNQKSSVEKIQIIDKNQNVHMAHMDIHFGKSVNGVAAIHTQILKDSELHDFYEMYPDKFNNKTNGITFRRWLYACNPQLTSYIIKLVGKEFLEDASVLKNLINYGDDARVLHRLLEIKQEKKEEWIAHIEKKQDIHILKDAIFDTQVKRLHEYKRQQMNALYIIHKYLEIKKGLVPKRPIVFIFGAKAAPAYTTAKDIIHVLLCLSELIREDKEVSKYLQLCFIENYNVSEAELVVPASDISEQISLASKEASGTGNMKFMLNGALTLGTRDGANVEIADLVGEENIYIFGESSEQVIAHYENKDYISKTYYEEDEHIKELVDFLVSKDMLRVGNKTSLKRFYQELLNKDWFMTLLDLNDYITSKETMLEDYEDRYAWSKKMLLNIANSGFFSSDRTIKEYNKDIWNLR